MIPNLRFDWSKFPAQNEVKQEIGQQNDSNEEQENSVAEEINKANLSNQLAQEDSFRRILCQNENERLNEIGVCVASHTMKPSDLSKLLGLRTQKVLLC